MSQEILTEGNSKEVQMYFAPKIYSPTKEDLWDAVNSAIYSGIASGCDLDRWRFGEVRLYFNPLYHTDTDRRLAIDRITKVILNAKSEFEED